MDESSLEPEPEKPRFLLPDGCKDLMDVVHLQQMEALTKELRSDMPAKLRKLSPKMPDAVTLPDPVTLHELASALHLKPFVLLQALMQFDIFAAPNTRLPYDRAAALCLLCGVTPTKAA